MPAAAPASLLPQYRYLYARRITNSFVHELEFHRLFFAVGRSMNYSREFEEYVPVLRNARVRQIFLRHHPPSYVFGWRLLGAA